MVARVIIGANYGDEGKGTVVAHYAKNADGQVLNILTNGGPQRAHSILTENGSFTFQHFGSGTYYGADNYFSGHFILNPFVFVDEYKRLTDRGVLINKVYRDPRCRWSTPWDMMANQILEQSRGKSKHGSCGMGIWETICRYNASLTISFSDFAKLDDDFKIFYLKSIIDYYDKRIIIPETWKTLFFSPTILSNFINDCMIFDDITTEMQLASCVGYGEIILENGQGLMLNDTGYDIPGTTPSKTGSEYANYILSQIGANDVFTHYVTRPYLTRHGKGYLVSECWKGLISGDIQSDRTNHYNPFQDNFRFAPLDISKLKERIRKDNGVNPILEVTHCDEMDRIPEFKKEFEVVNTFDSALIK